MNPAVYLPLILLFLALWLLRNNHQAVAVRKIIKKKKLGENTEMKELAEKFIGKECIIYSLNSQFDGLVKEVTDGAILIEKGGLTEAINLDFVIRIREYPRNKKGKKKAVVIG